MNKKEYQNMEKSYKTGNKILISQLIIISLLWGYIIKYIL